MKSVENASSIEDNELMVEGVRDNSLDRSPWSLDRFNTMQLKSIKHHEPHIRMSHCALS